MDLFLSGLMYGFLTVVYFGGMILAGKFYRWSYKSEVLPFDLDEIEFVLSLFWIVSIPIYFLFLMVYGLFGSIYLLYKKYV